MGNLKLKMGCPYLTSRAVIIHNTGAFISDGSQQHLLDCTVELLYFALGQASPGP